MNDVGSNPNSCTWRRYGNRIATTLLALVAMLGAALAGATTVVPLSLKETVRQADAIVVGTVLSHQSRWGNVAKRWMETDYTLAVEDVVHGSGPGVASGQTIVLTYWGGTLEGESQGISDMRLPRPGERLLVMLQPGWAQRVGFTPVVGFNQGLFSVSVDPNTGASIVVDFEDVPVALDAQHDIVRRTERNRALSSRSVDLAHFVRWLRTNVDSIKRSPPELRPAVDRSDPRVMKTFAKIPLLASPTSTAFARVDSAAPRVAGAAAAPATLSTSIMVDASAAPVTVSRPFAGGGAGAGPLYVGYGFKPNLPIAVNNYPNNWQPWTPEDEYQMSKWNHFASGVFQVYTTPTGTYQWQDNVFDLTGWPSSADLQNQYGRGWGANEIGVCFYRWSGSTMLEADISLNPAFAFTLDDEWVYDGGAAEGFRQTMLHELGHMLGLDHNFGGMSVMNYFPDQFRAFAMPYMDDAEGIRAVHSGNVVTHADLGIYLYYVSGFQNVADATFASSVNAGSSLTVNYYHLENVGTATINTPTVEWYLTTERNYNAAYYYLGTTTYPSLPRFNYFDPPSVSRTLTVPSHVPPGNYYLNAFIPNDSATGQATFPFNNNYAFSRNQVQVTTVPPSAPTIGVATAGNASAIVSFTPGSIGTGSFVSYTANCGGVSSIGYSSPITVLGLANGMTYTCRVYTTSTHGTSGWSAYSNPVTPSAPVVAKKRFDFNGDGKSDLFWDNGSANRWAYFMNGATVTNTALMPGAASGWVIANFGDFNGDGKTDVLWRNNANGSQYWIYLMNGNALIGGGPVNAAAGYVAKFVGDFNGDGKADILWDNNAGNRWVYLMNGAAVSSSLLMPGTAAGWTLAGVGDFNGDGKSDMIFRNGAVPSQHWIYLMNGNSLLGGGPLSAGSGYSLTGAADFNGDGKSDLLWENGAGGRWVYFMNGASISSAQTFPGAASGWTIVGSADFNGDGKSDVVWRNNAAPTQHWIYLLNGVTVVGGGPVNVGAGYSAKLPW
jgi:FG-GAP-like repeat